MKVQCDQVSQLLYEQVSYVYSQAITCQYFMSIDLRIPAWSYSSVWRCSIVGQCDSKLMNPQRILSTWSDVNISRRTLTVEQSRRRALNKPDEQRKGHTRHIVAGVPVLFQQSTERGITHWFFFLFTHKTIVTFFFSSSCYFRCYERQNPTRRVFSRVGNCQPSAPLFFAKNVEKKRTSSCHTVKL